MIDQGPRKCHHAKPRDDIARLYLARTCGWKSNARNHLSSRSYMSIRLLSLHRALPSTSHSFSKTSFTLSRLSQLNFHMASSPQRQNGNNSGENGDNGDQGGMDGEQNEWKYRAPYKVHDNDPNFHVRYEASCHCGKVQYQLSREKPLDSKYCHCTTCQKLHGMSLALIIWLSATVANQVTAGAPFQWATIFHKDDINFTKGHHDLGWYESSEKTCVHKLPCKVSCAYCRTPIMDEGRNMILLFPTLINFKSPEERKNFDIRYDLDI